MLNSKFNPELEFADKILYWMFRIFYVCCYRTGLCCTYYYRRVKKNEVSCYHLIRLHKNQSEIKFLLILSRPPLSYTFLAFPLSSFIGPFYSPFSSRSCVLYFDRPRNLLKFKTTTPPQYSGLSLMEEHFRQFFFFLPLTN